MYKVNRGFLEMPFLQFNSLSFLCFYLAAFVRVSLQANDETRSVKKDLKIVAAAESVHVLDTINQSQSINLTNDVKSEEGKSLNKVKTRIFQTGLHDLEVPESFRMAFYFFIALSVCAILFILVKIYRMRLSRAERKYGVHGDRSTQELTPLPMAIEDDSDNEDHTLFDINRQVRVS